MSRHSTPVKKASLPTLNIRQMQYAKLRGIEGLPKSTAYVKAGYKADTVQQAASLACRLEKVPEVHNYIQTLKENEWIKNALSMAEKRSFLAEVVRAAPGELDEKSPLVQSYKKVTTDNGESVELKMVDKATAIKLDNEIAGHSYKDRNESTANPFLFILAMGQSSQGVDLDEVADVEIGAELVSDSAGAV